MLFLASQLAFGQQWTTVGSPIEGGAADQSLGFDVGINKKGDVIAIGAPFRDFVRLVEENGELVEKTIFNVGGADIYAFDGTNWVQVGSTIEGELQFDTFGDAISTNDSGSRVAIGAPNTDRIISEDPLETEDFIGDVEVYEFDGTDWVQLGTDIEGDFAGDRLGVSVSLDASGNRLVVGIEGSDVTANAAGEARIYEYDGTDWVQLGSSINGDAEFTFLGNAVDISADGQRVVIGAESKDTPNGDNSGSVSVYEFNGSDWVQLGDDLDGEAADDDFGFDVAIDGDGDTIVIGGQGNDGDDGLNNRQGHSRVFKYNDGAWEQIGADIDGENPGNASGWTVDIDREGELVAIGEPGFIGDNSVPEVFIIGKIRLFEVDDDELEEIDAGIFGESPIDASGNGLALSGDGETLITGETGRDVNKSNGGGVRIFTEGDDDDEDDDNDN